MYLFPSSVTEKRPLCPLQFFWKANGRCIVASSLSPSPRSLDRSTGFDIFSATDPVKSLSNFRKGLVDSKVSTRTPIVYLSKYFPDSSGRNHQLHGFLFGLYQVCLSNLFSTRRESHWAPNALKKVTRLIYFRPTWPFHPIFFPFEQRPDIQVLLLIFSKLGRCPFFIFYDCCLSILLQCSQFLHGLLDKESVLFWSLPALCRILKWYCWSGSSHLATCPSGFFIWRSHTGAARSVLIRISSP